MAVASNASTLLPPHRNVVHHERAFAEHLRGALSHSLGPGATGLPTLATTESNAEPVDVELVLADQGLGCRARRNALMP